MNESINQTCPLLFGQRSQSFQRAGRHIWKGALAASYSSGHARPGMRGSEVVIKLFGMTENLIILDLIFLPRYLGGETLLASLLAFSAAFLV